jgi:thioredoxin-related protein
MSARLLGGLLIVLSLGGSAALQSSPEPQVMPARDLAAIAHEARERGLPIALVVSMDHCPWCERLEEDFLKPMLLSGDYVDRVIICKLDLDSSLTVRDFEGRETTGRRIAERYDVYLAPTVLLLGHRGEELVPRLTGMTTPDFYGGYLDAAIDESIARLRAERSG